MVWPMKSADHPKQLTNWLVAFATPIFLARSAYGAYFLFGSLSSFTVVILAMWMPETRGKSLEAIERSFPQPRPIASAQQHSAPLFRRSIQRPELREEVQAQNTFELEESIST